jgi:hypothetical protein
MINHIHIWEPLALVGHVEDVSQYASVHPQEENIFLPILVDPHQTKHCDAQP